MKDVQQKTLEKGVETTFEMTLSRTQFLVKNFTEDSITVRLGDNETVSVIGAGSWERVFNNIIVHDKDTIFQKNYADSTKIVKITSVAGGMVEVASVDF